MITIKLIDRSHQNDEFTFYNNIYTHVTTIWSKIRVSFGCIYNNSLDEEFIYYFFIVDDVERDIIIKLLNINCNNLK